MATETPASASTSIQQPQQAADGSQPFILYNHPASSYAIKVRIALREKEIPFTVSVPSDFISPASPSPSAPLGTGPLTAANPRAEVPALILPNGFPIFDSTIILEYLEDCYPSPHPLLPPAYSHPEARATARMIEDVCDTSYEAVNWGIAEIQFMKRAEGKPELEAQLMTRATQQIRLLQSWLEDKLVAAGGEWFSGSEFGFGWADLCVAPYVNRSVFYGLGPDPEGALGKWFERVKQRESVKLTFAEANAAVAKMGDMAEAFRSGKLKRQYRDYRLEWMVKSGGVDIVLSGMKDGNVRFGWP